MVAVRRGAMAGCDHLVLHAASAHEEEEAAEADMEAQDGAEAEAHRFCGGGAVRCVARLELARHRRGLRAPQPQYGRTAL